LARAGKGAIGRGARSVFARRRAVNKKAGAF
jgi:hypothetical protein